MGVEGEFRVDPGAFLLLVTCWGGGWGHVSTLSPCFITSLHLLRWECSIYVCIYLGSVSLHWTPGFCPLYDWVPALWCWVTKEYFRLEGELLGWGKKLSRKWHESPCWPPRGPPGLTSTGVYAGHTGAGSRRTAWSFSRRWAGSLWSS